MKTVPLSGPILATHRDPVAATSSDLPIPWQLAMRKAVRSTSELTKFLGLSGFPSDADHGFPVFAPHEYLQRIRQGDMADPLLLQILPSAAEAEPLPGFSNDPVGDLDSQRLPGMIQKYAGRALLITTSACAVHCRYCFRRHFPYVESSLSSGPQREAVLKEIRDDHSLEEVLLSGGDPLTLPDRTLEQLVDDLNEIPHLQRLRVHTRLPIMIPQRVTEPLLKIFSRKRLATWFVVHVNHVRELDSATLDALARLIDAGIPVLNQAVLLRGVNDNADALVDLCRKLVDHRVTPYYLHQLDRVAGAAHFEVSVEKGLQLMEHLRMRLPGYAVPRYVRDAPGFAHKEVLA